jgi:hypothetical protein
LLFKAYLARPDRDSIIVMPAWALSMVLGDDPPNDDGPVPHCQARWVLDELRGGGERWNVLERCPFTGHLISLVVSCRSCGERIVELCEYDADDALLSMAGQAEFCVYCTAADSAHEVLSVELAIGPPPMLDEEALS